MIELIKQGGQSYLFGTFSNRWIDKEGQILTDAAHKEYIQFLDSHPERSPALWFWHIPDMEFANKADWWAYSNGFVSMLWPLTENEAEFVDNFSKLFEAGMSHGFTADFDEVGDVIKYRPFEASLLPIDKAANINTSIEVLRKEQKKMEDKFVTLAQTIGTQKAAEMLKALIEQEAELEAAQVATKEAPDEEIEEEAEEVATANEAEIVGALTALDGKIEEMIAAQQTRIDELSEQLETLTKQFAGAKLNGQSRASLKGFVAQLKNGGKSVIGNSKAVAGDNLAESKPTNSPQHTATSTHALAGLLPATKKEKTNA